MPGLHLGPALLQGSETLLTTQSWGQHHQAQILKIFVGMGIEKLILQESAVLHLKDWYLF